MYILQTQSTNQILSSKVILDSIIQYLIPITSFLVSFVAFGFTLIRFNNEKAKLKVSFPDTDSTEMIVDRTSNKSPDIYWQYKFRYIPSVIITNKSSKPISIYEFILNGSTWNLYTNYGEKYETTYKTNRFKQSGLIFTIADNEESLNYNLSEKNMLQPVINLAPYETVHGNLFFMYDTPLPNKAKMIIKTSRKNIKIKINKPRQTISLLVTDYVRPKLD